MTSDNGPGVRDLGGLSRDLDRVADNRAAADEADQASTPDGLVRVTANGNRRLTSIDVTTQLMERDAKTVGTTVMAAINEVLGQSFPKRAATTAPVAEVADRTVTAKWPEDGRITVTMTEDGEVVGVRITPQALRELDGFALGAHLVEASNHALDQVDELIAGAAKPTDAGDIDAVMERFSRRMDALLVDLERISSNLDAIRTS